jgi:dolichol kinase
MTNETPLHRGELGRKLYHLSAGLMAFGTPFISWQVMAGLMFGAFMINWRVLPRLGGRAMWRGDERTRGYSLGLPLYPLAIAGLCLIFQADQWRTVAVWAVLAFGDGMSSLVGMRFGGPRLPWNLRKSWSGLVAFVVFGTLGAAVLVSWTQLLTLREWSSLPVLMTGLLLAAVCAVVESLPLKLDDNLSIPAVGALIVAFLSAPLA